MYPGLQSSEQTVGLLRDASQRRILTKQAHTGRFANQHKPQQVDVVPFFRQQRSQALTDQRNVLCSIAPARRHTKASVSESCPQKLGSSVHMLQAQLLTSILQLSKGLLDEDVSQEA